MTHVLCVCVWQHVAQQLLSALASLHQQGLVHGRVTTDTVLMTADCMDVWLLTPCVRRGGSGRDDVVQLGAVVRTFAIHAARGSTQPAGGRDHPVASVGEDGACAWRCCSALCGACD